MNAKCLLIALFGSMFLTSSALALDDPELISDRLSVIEIQLDALTEFLVNNPAELIKICHVPTGNYMKTRVLLVPQEGVRPHLEHGGESLDYLIPADEAPHKGEWCDPFAGIN